MEHDEEAVTCTPHGATESRKQWKKRCPLCREGYSGPRILPCFHTFCLECLQFLAAIWPLVPGNEGEKPSFFCPVCKTLTLVPELGVEDFNENDYVTDMADTDWDLPARRPHCLVCSNGNSVKWVCAKCKTMLCNHCEYFHGQFAGPSHSLCPLNRGFATAAHHTFDSPPQQDIPRSTPLGSPNSASADPLVAEDGTAPTPTSKDTLHYPQAKVCSSPDLRQQTQRPQEPCGTQNIPQDTQRPQEGCSSLNTRQQLQWSQKDSSIPIIRHTQPPQGSSSPNIRRQAQWPHGSSSPNIRRQAQWPQGPSSPNIRRRAQWPQGSSSPNIRRQTQWPQGSSSPNIRRQAQRSQVPCSSRGIRQRIQRPQSMQALFPAEAPTTTSSPVPRPQSSPGDLCWASEVAQVSPAEETYAYVNDPPEGVLDLIEEDYYDWLSFKPPPENPLSMTGSGVRRIARSVHGHRGGRPSSLLPEPTLKAFKWKKAKLVSICAANEGVFLFGQKTEKRKGTSYKMAMFGPDGRKLSKIPMTSQVDSMALLEAENEQRLVVVDRDNSLLKWIDVKSFGRKDVQVNELRQISLQNPVLSKPAPGQSLYVFGTSEEGQGEIHRVLVSRSTPPISLDPSGTVVAFDVSSDGHYCAVLTRNEEEEEELTVEVYRKGDHECTRVAGFSFDDNKGSGDICFFVPKAAQRETGELIVVADYTKSRLLLLDHVTNCRILGQFRMESPLSLTKGSQGSLWLVCDSKRDESTVFVF